MKLTLALYPYKIIELGTHLGFESEKLRVKYKNWGGYGWQKELDLLKSSDSNQ
jgi:hypothetical protein